MIREEARKLIPGDKIKFARTGSRWQGDTVRSDGNYARTSTITLFTVNRVHETGNTIKIYCDELRSNCYFTFSQIESGVLKPRLTDKETFDANIKTLKNNIAKAKAEITACESKLTFMETTKSTKFDPVEFQAYTVLELIDNEKDMPNSEKAKLISQIMKTSTD